MGHTAPVKTGVGQRSGTRQCFRGARNEFRNRLGIGIAMRTCKAYRDLLASPRWQKLVACNGGSGSERMCYGAALRAECKAPLRSNGRVPCEQGQRSNRREEQAGHYRIPRYRPLAASGAAPQRLPRASTGIKAPAARDVLYVEALAAPDTINSMPEAALLAFADHRKVKDAMRFDGGDAEGCSPNLPARVSTTKRLPPASSVKAPRRSPSHGVL